MRKALMTMTFLALPVGGVLAQSAGSVFAPPAPPGPFQVIPMVPEIEYEIFTIQRNDPNVIEIDVSQFPRDYSFKDEWDDVDMTGSQQPELSAPRQPEPVEMQPMPAPPPPAWARPAGQPLPWWMQSGQGGNSAQINAGANVSMGGQATQSTQGTATSTQAAPAQTYMPVPYWSQPAPQGAPVWQPAQQGQLQVQQPYQQPYMPAPGWGGYQPYPYQPYQPYAPAYPGYPAYGMAPAWAGGGQ